MGEAGSIANSDTGGNALPPLDQLAAEAAQAGPGFAWLSALVDSALQPQVRDSLTGKILTAWADHPGVSGIMAEPDPALHEQFHVHMVAAFDAVAPWLMPLLAAARATVVAAPGVLFISVPTRLDVVYDVPQFIQATLLHPLPLQPGETLH